MTTMKTHNAPSAANASFPDCLEVTVQRSPLNSKLVRVVFHKKQDNFAAKAWWDLTDEQVWELRDCLSAIAEEAV